MQIRLMFFATLALAVFGLRTCGGPTSVVEKPAAATCTMTVVGAYSATTPCTAVAGNVATTNQTTIAITGLYTQGTPVTETIGMGFTGPMAAKTFTDASTSQYAAVVSLQGGAHQTWAAASNPKQGSVSITINSFTNMISSGGATEYTIHGTANVILQPVAGSGATGTVTMTVTF
jgi:hypothetical protein